MLQLRPDLVDGGYRSLPPARYALLERLRPNYPLRDGGSGYVGHPALADPAYARATLEVLHGEALALVEALLDGRVRPAQRRSPFSALPFLRADFWPWALAGAAAAALAAVAARWMLA